MNNEPFHVMAQEWRYFSREKAILHTLHLAQLPVSNGGSTVLIKPTPPTENTGGGTGLNFPMQVPPGSFGGAGNVITNTSFQSDCFGAVAYDGTITAQSKMGITVGPMGSADMRITMTPSTPGWFVVHLEGQSDLHTYGYEGPAGDGKITVEIYNGGGGTPVAKSIWQLFMDGGAGWTPVHPSFYVDSIAKTSCDALIYVTGPVLGVGTNIGSPPGFISMWMFKISG